MNASDTTALRFDAHRTKLSAGDGSEVVIDVGICDIAGPLFQHATPTSLELERAIEVVEDALVATGLRHSPRGDLLIDDPLLKDMLDLHVDNERLDRDAVEACFQGLALASLGSPIPVNGHRAGREAAAALLLLREIMHHFGYEGIRR